MGRLRGTDEQRARHAAGLLPVDEAIEALTDDAFSVLNDQPRYPPTEPKVAGPSPGHHGRADLIVAPTELEMMGPDAQTRDRRTMGRRAAAASRAAGRDVTLREHRLSWRVIRLAQPDVVGRWSRGRSVPLSCGGNSPCPRGDTNHRLIADI